MRSIILLAVFLIIPVFVIITFIVSAFRYRKCPDEHVEEKAGLRKIMMISGMVSLGFIVSIIALFTLMFLAIANM